MNQELIARLFKLGWSVYKSLDAAIANTTPETLEMEKQKYAAFHGLSVLGDVESHVYEPRICALPDTMPLGQTMCKWPDGEITWDIVADIRGFQRGQVQEYVTEALDRIRKVCGISPQFTPGNPNARILVGSRNIDGPMGVLAESELPCGADQCHQWYDNSEPWGAFSGAGDGRMIDFIRVACHELCHALGMNHIGAGNLEAPVYSRSIQEPQAGDIQELQARYGPPAPPKEAPTPGDGDEWVIHVKGKLSIDGARVTRLLLN